MNTAIARSLAATATALVLAPTLAPAGPQETPPLAPPQSDDHRRLDLDTAVLWRASNTVQADTTIVATSLTLSSPSPFSFELGDLADVTLHQSFSLLAQSFVEGAENHYLGLAAAPVLVFTPRQADNLELLVSAGGGVGWLDSAGPPDGQGQDFTLNWFVRAGARLHLSDSLSLNVGVLFQHLSNGGATDYNPGLDSLGPTLGLSWRF